MNLNWKFNQERNVHEASFAGILKSVSEQTFELNNEKKTKYRIATVELEGKAIQAMMYEKNYAHGVKMGDSYSCRATYDPKWGNNQPLITVSHLPAAQRATLADLGFSLPDAKSQEKKSELANAKTEFSKENSDTF